MILVVGGKLCTHCHGMPSAALRTARQRRIHRTVFEGISQFLPMPHTCRGAAPHRNPCSRHTKPLAHAGENLLRGDKHRVGRMLHSGVFPQDTPPS